MKIIKSSISSTLLFAASLPVLAHSNTQGTASDHLTGHLIEASMLLALLYGVYSASRCILQKTRK